MNTRRPGRHPTGGPAMSCYSVLASTVGEQYQLILMNGRTTKWEFSLETSNKSTSPTMPSQQLPRVSPNQGLTGARKVLDDAVTFHLDNGGPAEARLHVERLANELKFYDDCTEAYREAMARIAAAEKAGQLQAEERQQQMMQTLLMSMIGVFRNNDQEGEPQASNGAQPDSDDGTLLPKLCTEKAMLMWQQLQQAGLIDKDYQPVKLSRTEMAILAYEMAKRLDIDDKWKTFEKLWKKKNLRNDYNESLNQQKSIEFRDRLKEILSSVPPTRRG